MATMHDIARQCGVSIQTVSRILRGHTSAYRDRTVQAVLEAAGQLGYQPPWASLGRPTLGYAGADAGRKHATLGVISTLGGVRAMQRVSLIGEIVQRAGYQLCVMAQCDSPSQPSHPSLLELARSLVDQGGQGMFVVRSRPVDTEERRALVRLGVPVVFVDWGPPRWPARVVLNRERAFNQVADHLAELGHRRVAFMASAWTADFLEHRILPLRRALAKRGLELVTDADWLLPPEIDQLEQQAYRMAGEMVTARRDVTALIASNDHIALAAVAGVQALGMSVPGDLSVVGYDDLPMSPLYAPSLTTVQPPVEAVGQAAAAMMLQMLNSPDQPVKEVVLKPRLVIRESTGPAHTAEVAAGHHQRS